MIVFISTQNLNSAAGKFYQKLIEEISFESLILYQENKGIIKLIRLVFDLRKILIKNKKEKSFTIITDCGWLKTYLIILFSFTNHKNLYLFTTYYHHIFRLKECLIYTQVNEIWKYISLNIYKYLRNIKLINTFYFITVSKFTYDRLKVDYNIPKKNIFICWNHLIKDCIDSIEKPKVERLTKSTGNFILIISSLQKRKNLDLIKYISNLYKTKVLLICPKPKSKFENKFLNKLRSYRINILHSIDEERKLSIFQKCNCLLIPSNFEGLSLLAIEGIIYRIPMIISKIPPHLYWQLPSKYYADPINKLDIKRKIDNYMNREIISLNYFNHNQIKDLIFKCNRERKESIQRIIDISKN